MARKKVDTAAVKRVIRGKQALRRIAFNAGRGHEFGAPLPGEAYGSDFRADHLTPAGKQYLFTIDIADGSLRLSIDTYSATTGRSPDTYNALDAEAWQFGILVIEAPLSRRSYQLLQHAARRFLAGRDTWMPGGWRLPGLQMRRMH